MTSATIIDQLKKNCVDAVTETDPDNLFLADYMLHDFSARGMSSLGSTIGSGMGVLTGTKGSDSVAAIRQAQDYYGEPMAGNSVNATEHSISSACMGIMSETAMIEYFMDQYPTGILSLVADTFDLTKVVKPQGYIESLKDKILSREGKLVLRPDSSPRTPADIICGHNDKLSERELEADYPEFYRKGLIQCLWDIFGGTTNNQGYKVLDSHIGAIYGEAIGIEMQKEIYQRLKDKGFAATNILLGVGSKMFTFNTRDTLGFAAKGTHCVVDGKGVDIYKDPITSSGFKKSAKGRMRVDLVNGEYVTVDGVTSEEEAKGELVPIYQDGKLLVETNLEEIRDRLNPQKETQGE